MRPPHAFALSSLSALLLPVLPAQGEPAGKPEEPQQEPQEPQEPEEPPAKEEPWFEKMDFGPAQGLTVEHAGGRGNDTLKGQVLRLGDGSGVVFDTELLRLSAGWIGGNAGLELRGTPFDGAHGPMSTLDGRATTVTTVRPGWAGPGRSYDDPREIPHGPLPREWGRWLGHYLHGRTAVLHYQVGGTEVFETYDVAGEGDRRLLVRTIEVRPAGRTMELRLTSQPDGSIETLFADDGLRSVISYPEEVVVGEDEEGNELTETRERMRVVRTRGPERGEIRFQEGELFFGIPPHAAPVVYEIVYFDGPVGESEWIDEAVAGRPGPRRPSELTGGGPARWPDVLTTEGVRAPDDQAYVVDWIAHPDENPWHANMRLCAIDFFSDGRAAVSTWNGDVWIVSGIDDDLDELRWKRFATGLYDPLGLKIVDDVVHTHGRDQLTRLHDLDGDGEADHYECFNNDVMITKAFHEFAFDLQTDAEGNFYFSKGGPVNPGGRGFMKLVPHHGTVMRVPPDGSELEVVVHGLRAPNGIGVGPSGVITTGDNEGTWMPRCRLNYIEGDDFFGGVMDMLPEGSDKQIYDLPLCWMPMNVDNSSGGQTWVTSDRWGPHRGGLLHCSYGTCSLYRVLPEKVDGQIQGGVVRYPVNFRSSCMRPRFNPVDGQLYVCGFRGWQTSASTEAAFHRVRYTGKPSYLPSDLHVTEKGVYVTFDQPLDPEFGGDPESYAITVWNYEWTEGYGSPEVSVFEPEREAERGSKNRDPLEITAAKLSSDQRTVFLEVPAVLPVMQMRIQYNVDAADGALVKGDIYGSVHELAEDAGFPGGH